MFERLMNVPKRSITAGLVLAALLLIVSALFFSRGRWEGGTFEAVGEFKELSTDGKLVVKMFEKNDLILVVTDETKVTKNKAKTRPDSLEPGDVLRATYYRSALGVTRATEVSATSPFFKGRLVDINLRHQEVTIKGGFSARVFTVGSQTVILRKSSLMNFKNLERGMLVRAEFSGTDKPQLDELKVLE